jgi:dipeptidyl aminopeptidase/acylaminoacyl peptidase
MTCVTLAFSVDGNKVAAGGADYARALSDRLGVQAEGFEVAGRPAFVLLPEKTAATKPQPWIMYAPALPDYPDKHEQWMHQRFVKAGVAVAGVDIGEAYGSPRGNDALSALYEHLVETRGFARRPCLFGRSRGGLWVTSWAGANPDKVAGIAGIYPVFDLRTYPGLEKAAPAYEFSVEQLLQNLPRLNPIEQADSLARAKVPAMFIHGLDDELVPFKENTAEFARRYKAAGADKLVTVLAIEGQGHNFWEGFFRCEELVDFAIARVKQPRP